MLVKKSTLTLMYKAGNKKAQELVAAGVDPYELRSHSEDIRAAMEQAFNDSGDRSSGHDASNRICDFLEQMHEDVQTYDGEFVPLEPYMGR